MPQNPQAFPCVGYGPSDDSYCQEGMTLRDWFAGQCLAGFMSQHDTPLSPGYTIEEVRETAVRSWYAWADAMLAERERGQ